MLRQDFACPFNAFRLSRLAKLVEVKEVNLHGLCLHVLWCLRFMKAKADSHGIDRDYLCTIQGLLCGLGWHCQCTVAQFLS